MKGNVTMSNSATVKPKKPRRIFRKILKVIGIILAVILVIIAILSVRNLILCKRDNELVKDAYGEYFTTSNGARMNYTLCDSTSDKVAVILPGYGSPTVHYEFDAVVNGLKDKYKIVIVEPLGYGLSDETDSPRTVENYCEELHSLMEYLGYDRYTLIGHSLAGIYSLYYANTYTDEVESFIGIDSSVPHQIDRDDWSAKPDNVYHMYEVMRWLYFRTGISRVLYELSIDEEMANIPTLTEADKDKVLAMYCSKQFGDTQMNEMKLLGRNMEKCYDMKFPESVPVLYVLAKDNCDMMPEWEGYHKDIVTSPESVVTVVEGQHYVHFTNLKELLELIMDWKY